MPIGKILVVDDEHAICKMVKEILEFNDFTVTTITNSVEALNQINQKADYDVILSDLNMPNVNGLDLLKEANKQSNKNYQFILITGSYDETLFKDLCNTATPFALINKPFTIDVLTDTVIDAINHKNNL